MGSPPSEPCRDSDETQHQVTLTRAFELSAYETTQGEFLALMGYNPSSFTSCGTTCPVENVNWHEAASYCNALSAETGVAKCYSCSGTGASVTCAEATSYSGVKVYDCPGYRLPTEAEWEWAYRAGTTTAFYNGANDSTKCTSCSDAKADVIAWYTCNSNGTTHPKGQKAANSGGLFDLAGNVWEWCHDWYQSDLGSAAVTDPCGSSPGPSRVIRGGSWQYYPNILRAAERAPIAPASGNYFFGFRCGRTLGK